MANVKIISIVPVELFTDQNAAIAKDWLNSQQLATKNTYSELSTFIDAYTDNRASSSHELMALSLEGTGNTELFVMLVDTSIIFVYTTTTSIANFDHTELNYLASARKKQNKWLLTDGEAANESLIKIKEGLLDQKYTLSEHVKPSYGFTFYYFKFEEDITDKNADFLRQVMEPSSHNTSYAPQLENLGTHTNSHIYVNWSTVCVAEINRSHIDSTTINEIIALEVALQISWNRCHAMSGLIDKMLKNEHQIGKVNTEKLYNSFFYATDEVKSLLAPMTSGRTIRFYDKMIETSRIDIQKDRLETRLKLLSRHDEREEIALLERHQGSTDNFLLFFGLFMILSAIFGFKLTDLDNGWLIASVSIIAAIFSSLAFSVFYVRRKHKKIAAGRIRY